MEFHLERDLTRTLGMPTFTVDEPEVDGVTQARVALAVSEELFEQLDRPEALHVTVLVTASQVQPPPPEPGDVPAEPEPVEPPAPEPAPEP